MEIWYASLRWRRWGCGEQPLGANQLTGNVHSSPAEGHIRISSIPSARSISSPQSFSQWPKGCGAWSLVGLTVRSHIHGLAGVSDLSHFMSPSAMQSPRGLSKASDTYTSGPSYLSHLPTAHHPGGLLFPMFLPSPPILQQLCRLGGPSPNLHDQLSNAFSVQDPRRSIRNVHRIFRVTI